MTFSNDVLSFECAYQRSGDSIFAGKKCPKTCLTIHWSVKRRDIDLVWELLASSNALQAESNFVPDCSSLFCVL